MYEGAIIGEVDPRTTTREAIGLMMAGVPAAQAHPAEAQVTQEAHEPDPARQPATDGPAGLDCRWVVT